MTDRTCADAWHAQLLPSTSNIDIRVDRDTWADVEREIFDFDTRERAGVLFVRSRPRGGDVTVLIGLEWMPVPDQFVRSIEHGLAYDGRFALRVADKAQAIGAGAVLVHAHPGQCPPRPSLIDAEKGASFLSFMRRRCPDATHGLLVVGDDTITGIADTPNGSRRVAKLVSSGIPTREWLACPSPPPTDDADHDRQLLAIGPHAHARLRGATVAVIGNSGGGSHGTQQLIHAGIGRLIVVDPDTVALTNLRRLVGAIAADVDVTLKVDVATRTAAAVRPEVRVDTYPESFPSTATIAALREADIIIGCVDGWDGRDDLNTFALNHRIPYVDIGIAVAGPIGHLGMRVGGQIIVVAPDGPCARCMGLVTDERVAASRRERQGYANRVPDPQVVSLNGTLASEAVTATLMLLAGDTRVARYRRYMYPPGRISEVDARRSPDCPACSSAGLSVLQELPAEEEDQPRPWWRRLAQRSGWLRRSAW